MSQSTVDDGKSQQPSTNPSYASSGVGTASFVSTTSENEKLTTIIYVKIVAAIVSLFGGAILAITINLWMPVRNYPEAFYPKPCESYYSAQEKNTKKPLLVIPNVRPDDVPFIEDFQSKEMDVIRGNLCSSTGQCLFGFNGDGKGQVGVLDNKSKYDFPLVEYSGYDELKVVFDRTDYCLNVDNQSEIFTQLCNHSQHHVSERFLYLNNKSIYSIENGKCLGINSKLIRQGNRRKYHTIELEYCSNIASQMWNFV